MLPNFINDILTVVKKKLGANFLMNRGESIIIFYRLKPKKLFFSLNQILGKFMVKCS